MTTKTQATVEDLYQVPGKAEIVNGELVLMSPTGNDPGYAADAILVSLWHHAENTGLGQAVGDNKGFLVDLPNRRSFSPDAAFYAGPDTGMRFFERAPVFAVEVRSEGDYGPSADYAIAAKRADYFAAGTLVVWDVDLLSPDVVRSYRADHPEMPTIFRRGEVAEAEPAVQDWRFPVDRMFKVRAAMSGDGQSGSGAGGAEPRDPETRSDD
jgi:Uma2 family endonuclease